MIVIALLALVLGLSFLLAGWLQIGRDRSITDVERAYAEMIADVGFGEGPQSLASPKSDTPNDNPVKAFSRMLGRSRFISSREGHETLGWLERELTLAGRPNGWSAVDALAAVILWWGGVGGAAVVLYLASFPTALLVILFVAGALYPPLKLRQMRKARQARAWSELPVFINEIIMGLTSGMTTIDDALGRVVQDPDAVGSQRVLVQEFGQAYAEYRHGNRDREEALHDAAARLGVPAVDNFVDAIVQGLRTGAPIRDVLESQSAQAQAIFKQEMRALIARKESSFVISLFMVMFGLFIMVATPMFLQVFSTFE